MPLVILVFEQLMQWKYGVGGAALATFLIGGIKAKSEVCQCLAVVVFLLLLL